MVMRSTPSICVCSNPRTAPFPGPPDLSSAGFVSPAPTRNKSAPLGNHKRAARTRLAGRIPRAAPAGRGQFLASALLAACLAGCATPAKKPAQEVPSAQEQAARRDLGPLEHEWAVKGTAHPYLGRIRDPQAGVWTSEDALRERLTRARFLLLGETHDNPDHHALQARALALLVKAGRRPALVLEMVDRSKQPILDEAVRQGLSADALAERLSWSKSGWPAFASYRPIFEVALTAKLPLVAGNLPLEEVRALAKDGEKALTPEQRAALREAPLPTPAEQTLVTQLIESHCGHLPAAMTGNFVLAQRARDLQMAQRLLAAGTSDGAVLIAGAGHVREDHGVPQYLRGTPPEEILSVAFLEIPEPTDAESTVALTASELPYDVVVYTPRVSRPDPCKAFKERR